MKMPIQTMIPRATIIGTYFATTVIPPHKQRAMITTPLIDE